MARQLDPSAALTDKIRMVMRRKCTEREELEHRKKLLEQQILGLTQDINALRYLEKNFSADEMDIKKAYLTFLENGGD